MMVMVYKWNWTPAGGVDAQIAGEELERIRTWNNGRLDPAQVVNESKSKGAPLHPCFEWNDKVAAASYRIEQAKFIIRSIDVVVEKAKAPKETRAFVSVVRDDDRSYTSTAHALSDKELRQQVVDEALRALEAWRKRYAELTELADVFAAIDQARGA